MVVIKPLFSGLIILSIKYFLEILVKNCMKNLIREY